MSTTLVANLSVSGWWPWSSRWYARQVVKHATAVLASSMTVSPMDAQEDAQCHVRARSQTKSSEWFAAT